MNKEYVSVETKNLKIVDIIKKEKEEFNQDESKYKFTLRTNDYIKNCKGNLILEKIADSTYKDIYTGTIIKYLQDNSELDVNTRSDYRNKIGEISSNPIYITGYKENDMNNKINLEDYNKAIMELGNIMIIAENNIEEKHQEILNDDISYRKNVIVKILENKDKKNT